MFEFIKTFDTALLTLINVRWRNAPMDSIFPVLSDFGYFKIPAVIVCLLILVKGSFHLRKNVFIVVMVVLLSDFTVSSLLKPLFGRVRPCHVVQSVHLLGNCSDSFSFPSSHAVNISAFAFTMSRFYPTWKILFWTTAAAVCYSRIYMGMHYPTDCICGFLVGILIAYFPVKYLPSFIEKN